MNSTAFIGRTHNILDSCADSWEMFRQCAANSCGGYVTTVIQRSCAPIEKQINTILHLLLNSEARTSPMARASQTRRAGGSDISGHKRLRTLQTRFTDELLENTDMLDCKPACAPVAAPGRKLRLLSLPGYARFLAMVS
jgi:hypothetical protein